MLLWYPRMNHCTPERRHKREHEHHGVTVRELRTFIVHSKGLIPTLWRDVMVGMPLQLEETDV